MIKGGLIKRIKGGLIGGLALRNWGSRRNGAARSPEMGVFAPPSPFFKNV